MKLITKILFAALLIAGVNSAFADTQDRHLSNFRAISSSSLFDLYITQGPAESVKVEASSTDIDYVITEVKGDVLAIHDKNGHFNWDGVFGSNRKTRIYITVKDIHSISISGSGDVYFKDGINAGKLSLRSSGSGDIEGQLKVQSLETGMSGSGDVKLSGTATTATLSINGSGDFAGRRLITTTTMVRLSGSGDASVNATQRLDASSSGSGDIEYTGSAKVSSTTTGSGDITRS